MSEEEDEDTIVIEVTPAMRVMIIVAGVMLVMGAIWFFGYRQSEDARNQYSRVPGDILGPEDYTELEPRELMTVESMYGVDIVSTLNIERLAAADRAELEKIFEELASTGLPDIDSEENQLFDALVQRSAQIAPNRSLRFYDMFEDTNNRTFATSRLFRYWFEEDPDEAMESVDFVAEPIRLRVLSDDLIRMAETRPEKAFELSLMTIKDMFRHVQPNFVRPVIRTWAQQDFGGAYEAMSKLTRPNGGRDEALQGVSLAKLDLVSDWKEAFAWASSFKGEDRLLAQVIMLENGIFEHTDRVEDLVSKFPHQLFGPHLRRTLEAKKKALQFPESDRLHLTVRMLRSLDPYDHHGRRCIINAIEDPDLRERDSIMLQFRWPDVAGSTFLADSYSYSASVPQKLGYTKFTDLLADGDRALSTDQPDVALQHYRQYMHYNPEDDEAREYLTKWSKAAGLWLGPEAKALDAVRIKAQSIPEDTDFFEVMSDLAEEFEKQTGKKLPMFFFEAVSGISPRLMWAWGDHGDVSLREALDVLTAPSGLALAYEEFGITGFYWRDEDIAPVMGMPSQMFEYQFEQRWEAQAEALERQAANN